MLFACAIAAAEPLEVRGSATKTDFDIPSQPLAAALERYGDSTGRQIIYNSNLAAGRRSGVVKGALTSDGALIALLAGTGLQARHIADKSLILEASPAVTPAAATVAPPAQFRHYYGRIQAGLRDALCGSGVGRPGSYRIAVRLWFGAAGDVERYERLSSTRHDDVDSDIDSSLRHLRLDEPLPAGFAQPVTVVVMPQSPSVTRGCGGRDRGASTLKAGP